MWTSIACKYFYLLPLKLENMFCICDPCFRPAQIAAEIGSGAVTALTKFTIYTSIDVQCPAFSLFLRENGLSFIHPDQEEISAAQGEGFLLCGPWKSSWSISASSVSSSPLQTDAQGAFLQGRKKLLNTPSSWLAQKTFHRASGWESNEQGLMGKNTAHGERAMKMFCCNVLSWCLLAQSLKHWLLVPAGLWNQKWWVFPVSSSPPHQKACLKMKQAGKKNCLIKGDCLNNMSHSCPWADGGDVFSECMCSSSW